MNQKDNYLEMYETHYGSLIYRCICSGDLILAKFWLNSYRHDLIALQNIWIHLLQNMRSTSRRFGSRSIRCSMLMLIDSHFGDNEPEKEKYLRELIED